jgi:hypothetical protein
VTWTSITRVEAVWNTFTIIPVSRKRRQNGNLVLSDETAIYGYESSATLATDRLHYELQTVLSSERVPEVEGQTNCPAKEKKKKSGHGSQRGARKQDRYAD